jgi:UDP-glucose 4-epimerase
VTGGLGYIGSITVARILQRPDMLGFDKIVIVDTKANAHK